MLPTRICAEQRLCFFGLLFVTSCCLGATLRVAQDGSGDFSDLQTALYAAEDRDRVLVAPGEYVIYETLRFNRLNGAGVRDIMLISESGPTETEIRLNSTSTEDAVVAFHSGESPATIIEGFTLRGSLGAGVTTMRSSPVILNCVITANRSHGVDADNATALVSCTIFGNGGNGIRANPWSQVQVIGCVISGNGRSGIFGDDGTLLTITNCLVTGNCGAGILAGEDGTSQTFVSFVTVSGNRNQGVQVEDDTSLFMASSIVYGNGEGALTHDAGSPYPEVRYSCINWPGLGNIQADPLFVASGTFDFNRTDEKGLPDFIINPGDYRLSSGSPCIDGATDVHAPLEDILGNPRPCGAEFDMGAYENSCPPAQLLFQRGDPNADNKHDLADVIFILTFLFADGDTPQCLDAADANDSGKIDLADAINVLDYLFGDAEHLPLPFPACGPDPTLDDLDCAVSTCGE